MVRTTDQSDVVRAIILLSKIWAGIVGAFCCLASLSEWGIVRIRKVYLHNGKASSVRFHLRPIDITLPPRDIAALRVRSFVETGRAGADES